MERTLDGGGVKVERYRREGLGQGEQKEENPPAAPYTTRCCMREPNDRCGRHLASSRAAQIAAGPAAVAAAAAAAVHIIISASLYGFMCAIKTECQLGECV